MKHLSLKTKRIILTTVAILAAVVFVLFSRIETPAEHDKRVNKEQDGNVNIIEEITKPSPNNVTLPANDNITPSGEMPSPTVTAFVYEPSVEVTPSNGQEVEAPTNTEKPTPSSVPSIEPDKPATLTVTAQTVTKPASPEHTQKVTERVTPETKPTKDLTPTNTPTAVPEKKEYIRVSLVIGCKRVLGNEELNTSSVIPEDGIIFNGILEVVKGSNVSDVLSAVCRSKGIGLSNPTGNYVSSINGLAEKECGKESGWKYYVNSEAPNVGCAGYVLGDGDEVEWRYVLSWRE